MARGATNRLWNSTENSQRRPRHTRDQIATTALAVADREGIQAVSMRRVAKELNAGTMTLYHYVKSKTELLTLMADSVMREMLVPGDALMGHWRDALTAIAQRSRQVFIAHPWAVSGIDGGAGPNTTHHFEQSLTAVATTGLSATQKLELIALVDDFVCGFVIKTDIEPGIESLPPEAESELSRHLSEEISSGQFPQLAEFLGPDDSWKRMRQVFSDLPSTDERFARGLQLLLRGAEETLMATLEPSTMGFS